MTKFKEYQLHKIQDLLDIPPDRLDAFFVDLKKWHKTGISAKKWLEALGVAVNEPLPENFMSMKWIDDGLHEIVFTDKQGRQSR